MCVFNSPQGQDENRKILATTKTKSVPYGNLRQHMLKTMILSGDRPYRFGEKDARNFDVFRRCGGDAYLNALMNPHQNPKLHRFQWRDHSLTPPPDPHRPPDPEEFQRSRVCSKRLPPSSPSGNPGMTFTNKASRVQELRRKVDDFAVEGG